MRLSEALPEDLILCDIKARTKRGALAAIIRRLVKCGKAAGEEALTEAVLGREKLQSTGIGGGIAVPHGVVKTARSLSCAMGISRRGIKYGSIDGQPVHLIVLFVSSKTRDVHYLSLLASVCRIFDSKRLRREVVAAESPQEVLQLIRAEEARECQLPGGLPA